jgi:hypothetical protein
MTVLLIVVGFVSGLILAFLRGLLGDEARGRVQRQIVASVEATIASLPQHLQDEWAEEWRSDLAETISLPITAAIFARNLRRSAAALGCARDTGQRTVPAELARNDIASRSMPNGAPRRVAARWLSNMTRLVGHYRCTAAYLVVGLPATVILDLARPDGGTANGIVALALGVSAATAVAILDRVKKKQPRHTSR